MSLGRDAMKILIILKKAFSVIAAVVLMITMYYGIDGYDYTFIEALIVSITALSVGFIWNRRLYNAILNDKSEVFKKSELNKFYYFLFEFFGFLMVFVIGMHMGYYVLIFLINR